MRRTLIMIAAVAVSAVAVSVNALGQDAFKHLSLGVDLGTTGAGVSLALPVVTDHLVLTAGYEYGNFDFTYNPSDGLDLSAVSAEINGYINDANSCLAQIPGENARLVILPNYSSAVCRGDVRLGTFKLGVELYPFKHRGFHISAGAYYGEAAVLDANAVLTDYWEVYNTDLAVARKMVADHPEYAAQIGDIPELKASIGGRVFEVKDNGNVNLGLEVPKLRPYVGLGFGRSIPDSRFGFQFDLGAIYTGQLALTSANEVSGTCDITISDSTIDKVLDLVDSFRLYPQLSLRLIYRIF